MRRKVNQVGSGTLTVSLPRKWAERVGLRKGDEIELVEEGHALVLGAKIIKRRREARIHIDSKNVHFVRNLIGSIFRGGADDIHITVADSTFMPRVREVLNVTPGCEFFPTSDKAGVIKNVVESFNFDTTELVRKMIITLSVVNDYTKDALKEGKYSNYDEIQALRWDIQKYRNLIGRSIALGENPTRPEQTLGFFLSQIGGIHREFYQWLAAHPKRSEKEASLVQLVGVYMREVMGMKRPGDDVYGDYAKIRDALQGAMKTVRPEVCAYLFAILRLTFASETLLLESKQKA